MGKDRLHCDESPLWDSAKGYVRVILRGLNVEARVGLHPWEMHPERPTRPIVNVEQFAHLPSAKSSDASDRPLIDYDAVRDAVRTWPDRPHVLLLETLADELVRLCFRNPLVEACRVSSLKPDVYNEAEGAGIELYRTRRELEGEP